MKPARKPVPSVSATAASSSAPTQWRVWLGLALCVVVMALNMTWPWGLLLLLWVVPSVFSGETHFIEQVRRSDSPVLFWALTLTWLAAGVYLLASPFTGGGVS